MRGDFDTINVSHDAAALRASLDHFMWWQQTLSGVVSPLLPRGTLTRAEYEKHLLPGMARYETLEDKKRRAFRKIMEEALRLSLESFKEMLMLFYEKTEDYLNVLEEAIDKQIDILEHTDPEAAQELREIKQEVREIKTEIREEKAQVKKRETLPTPKEAEEISENMVQKTSRVERIAQFFHDKIAKMMSRPEAATTAALAAEEARRAAMSDRRAEGYPFASPFPEEDAAETEEPEEEIDPVTGRRKPRKKSKDQTARKKDADAGFSADAPPSGPAPSGQD